MYDESELGQPIEVQNSPIIEGQITQIKQPVIEASVTPQQIYQESIPAVENGNDIF